jgi:hypothetical protein
MAIMGFNRVSKSTGRRNLMKGEQAWEANQLQRWNDEQDRIEDLEIMNTEQRDTCPNCGFDQDGENPTHCLSCAWPQIQNGNVLTTADSKHIPTSFSEWLEQNGDSIDIGGNTIPDRIQANEDQYQ